MDESKEIARIITDYFMKETGSEEEANKLINGLAEAVKEPGTKLVHIGNVLFLTIVRAKGVVEVHTIGNEDAPRDLANDFVELAKYLKNIGVTTAYTYTPDSRFGRLAKMTGLPVKEFKVDVEGKPMNAYVMEF